MLDPTWLQVNSSWAHAGSKLATSEITAFLCIQSFRLGWGTLGRKLGSSWPVYEGPWHCCLYKNLGRVSGNSGRLELAAICGVFGFVVCICHLGLGGVWAGDWARAGWYMWGNCIRCLYLASGSLSGIWVSGDSA